MVAGPDARNARGVPKEPLDLRVIQWATPSGEHWSDYTISGDEVNSALFDFIARARATFVLSL
jgi:hypothetical protein